MTRFRMASGEVVPAPKDCDCRTHEGPHWLHVDELDRRRNAELLPASPRGYAVEELQRVREKRATLERLGVVEILG